MGKNSGLGHHSSKAAIGNFQSELIRGVPKFIQQSGGLGLKYAQRQYNTYDTAERQSQFDGAQMFYSGANRFGTDMDIIM